MDATAASVTASGASSALMAVVMIPMPSGLVRIRSWPGRSPALVSMRAGSTTPVTAMPYLGSGSSMVWPPTTAKPASEAISRPPARTSPSRAEPRASLFQPTRLRAKIGVPPMA